MLHRSRKDERADIEALHVDDMQMHIIFAEGELEKHPLLHASLQKQAEYLQAVGFTLTYE